MKEGILVPVDRRIPVLLRGFPILFERAALLTEYLDDIHAGDVFDDGIVHFLACGIPCPHSLVAVYHHENHRDQPQEDRCQRRQRHAPIHREHCDHHKAKGKQVGKSLGDSVGQDQLHLLDIFHKILLGRARAKGLHVPHGHFQHLIGHAAAHAGQRVVGQFVRRAQSQPVELILQQQAGKDCRGHGQQPKQRGRGGAQKSVQYNADKKERRDGKQHRQGQQDDGPGHQRPFVARVGQYAQILPHKFSFPRASPNARMRNPHPGLLHALTWASPPPH